MVLTEKKSIDNSLQIKPYKTVSKKIFKSLVKIYKWDNI